MNDTGKRKRTTTKWKRRKGQSIQVGDAVVTVVQLGRNGTRSATLMVVAPEDVPVRNIAKEES